MNDKDYTEPLTNTNIHWFPGHMMKTFRLIEREMRNVDIVVELLDARIPRSSKNPELAGLTTGKPCLLLLNKSDLAQPRLTDQWLSHYRAEGFGAIAISSKDRKSGMQCLDAVKDVLKDKRDAQRERGMTGAKIRAMVVGVPNVGKSTFINSLASGAPAKAEDRPGVTRGKQWIALRDIELLDMPGVLWRRFEDQNTALKLAFTGAIKDDILDITEIAVALLGDLRHSACDDLRVRYKITEPLPESNYALLELIAWKRGMLLAKGAVDVDRAAAMLLDELRGGKLGAITFEQPDEQPV